jgi:hypothetical protein
VKLVPWLLLVTKILFTALKGSFIHGFVPCLAAQAVLPFIPLSWGERVYDSFFFRLQLPAVISLPS